MVAIHNKNGQGLLPTKFSDAIDALIASQSTIKMDKGYYFCYLNCFIWRVSRKSQSTIKMDKGYYRNNFKFKHKSKWKSQSTIKMDKGYY